MSMGMGVMINMLSGHGSGSADAIKRAVGQEIASVVVADAVNVTFKGGGGLSLAPVAFADLTDAQREDVAEAVLIGLGRSRQAALDPRHKRG